MAVLIPETYVEDLTVRLSLYRRLSDIDTETERETFAAELIDRFGLVDDQPGVTRDRKEAPGDLAGLPLTLIDTAGYEDANDGSLEARMRAQTEMAIEEADIALFLIDARAGVISMDERFADILRRADIPVVLAANKCEGKAGLPGLYDAFRLGFGEPVALSAEHGEGFGDLFEAFRVALGEDCLLYTSDAADE